MIRKFIDTLAGTIITASMVVLPTSMLQTTKTPSSPGGEFTAVASATSYELPSNTKTPATTLDIVNQYRLEHGIQPMAEDPALTAMANQRADDMVARQYFAHKNPEGKIFYQLMSEDGNEPAAACENLALSYGSDIGAPFRGWKDSVGHNACMLDDRMTRAGYAFRIYGTSYDAGNQLRTHYLVVAIHGTRN